MDAEGGRGRFRHADVGLLPRALRRLRDWSGPRWVGGLRDAAAVDGRADEGGAAAGARACAAAGGEGTTGQAPLLLLLLLPGVLSRMGLLLLLLARRRRRRARAGGARGRQESGERPNRSKGVGGRLAACDAGSACEARRSAEGVDVIAWTGGRWLGVDDDGGGGGRAGRASRESTGSAGRQGESCECERHGSPAAGGNGDRRQASTHGRPAGRQRAHKVRPPNVGTYSSGPLRRTVVAAAADGRRELRGCGGRAELSVQVGVEVSSRRRRAGPSIERGSPWPASVWMDPSFTMTRTPSSGRAYVRPAICSMLTSVLSSCEHERPRRSDRRRRL
jgi:hypothetical protein